MAQSIEFDKEIIAATAVDESTGYIDGPLKGEDVVIYVLTGAGVSAGTIKIEEAPNRDYTGTWGEITSVSTTAASSCYPVHFSGVFGSVRVRFDTSITGGNVSVRAMVQE